MKIISLKNKVRIHAPKEKVWEVLLDDRYNRIWYAEFSEGTVAVTDWKVGSKVIFKDPSESGLIGTVEHNKPHELLSIVYNGVLSAGQEDYTSEEALSMKGAKETYELTEENGATWLTTSADLSEDFAATMSKAWESALKKIIELSEKGK